MRVAWLSLLLLQGAYGVAAQEADPLGGIRDLRLRGDLAEARALAEQHLANGSLDLSLEIRLRLELARIHDRVGLHHNIRPVAAAMEQVEVAAAAIGGSSPALEAAIELARAELLYRAELGDREFPAATVHAHRAVEAYRRLGDRHGEAEGVHLLGLIHLQRRELPAARALFDRSLALDRAAGERPFFQGEYERHIGFVELFEGDTTAAVPHFERSLALRRQVGATDPSLFAATTLAATLLDLGRTEAARPHVQYAATVADGLDTPFGRAQVGLVSGRLHAQAGDREAASRSFETALALADSIGAQAIAQQSRSALDGLRRTPR